MCTSLFFTSCCDREKNERSSCATLSIMITVPDKPKIMITVPDKHSLKSTPIHAAHTRLRMLSPTTVFRAVVASPVAIKIYSLDFIRKPTNMPDSILSSAFVRRPICQRTHSYHTRPPNTHLPMWCPRPRHRSNGTFPSDLTVSKFSIVVACPSGICIWQLNSSSFLSVLTMPPPVPLLSRPTHFRRDRAQMLPGSCHSCTSYRYGDLWSPVSIPARPLTMQSSSPRQMQRFLSSGNVLGPSMSGSTIFAVNILLHAAILKDLGRTRCVLPRALPRRIPST